MKFRFLAIFLFAVSAQAAPMYRVAGIAGPSTIVVEREGVRSNVLLSGIEITDPNNASRFLSWTLGSSWVMVENGQVYRSPDGLLINAELVKKGFARFIDDMSPNPQHTPTVYLGELDLGPRQSARAPAKAPARPARAARPSPVRRRVPRSPATRAPLR